METARAVTVPLLRNALRDLPKCTHCIVNEARSLLRCRDHRFLILVGLSDNALLMNTSTGWWEQWIRQEL